MDNFCLHESNKKLFYENLKQLLDTHQKLSISVKPYRKKRSLSISECPMGLLRNYSSNILP